MGHRMLTYVKQGGWISIKWKWLWQVQKPSNIIKWGKKCVILVSSKWVEESVNYTCEYICWKESVVTTYIAQNVMASLPQLSNNYNTKKLLSGTHWCSLVDSHPGLVRWDMHKWILLEYQNWVDINGCSCHCWQHMDSFLRMYYEGRENVLL